MGQMKFSSKKSISKDKTSKLYQTLKEIYSNLERSIKNKKDLNDIILKDNRNLETTDTLLNEKPEPYTRRIIIDPILKSLGYESSELAWDARQDLGDSKKWSDYTLTFKDDSVLVEAESLNKDLNQKNCGIDQVRIWISLKKTKTDFGVATNGFLWVMVKFDNNTLQIKILKTIDLRPLFIDLIGQKHFADKEKILQDFYASFSKENIIFTFKEETFSLEKYQEEISQKFYSEYMDYVFGIEAKTGSLSRTYSLLTAIKPASGSTEEDLRMFAVNFMNRILFIKFLEEKEIVKKNLLSEMWSDFSKSRKMVPKGFYKLYLEPLFFDVLNTTPNRRNQLVKSIPYFEKIPYLNGGIFQETVKNELSYDIDDDILDIIINKYIESYHFTILDEKGVNPDILGYIFEKTINYISEPGTNKQRATGAYYSKSDITGYISRNTIIPFIFKRVSTGYDFTPADFEYIWSLVQKQPDRYVNDLMKHGINHKIPNEISLGIKDLSKRKNWNKIAESKYGLQNETWREVIDRRIRYDELLFRIKKGMIKSIDDFVNNNMKLILVMQDAISQCEDPKLLNAFYETMSKLTILDSAVGSGAFLFSALNVLGSLYEICLSQLQNLIDKNKEMENELKLKFTKILKLVDKHPNRPYFIDKSIIVNNMYGVDIMGEGTEICKLRLFLRLVSQINNVEQVEPLPDIDFNIRTGNSLVGFLNLEKVREAISSLNQKQKKLPMEEDKLVLQKIEKQANEADEVFQAFKKLQTDENDNEDELVLLKKSLNSKLNGLAEELDSYLSTTYGINIENRKEYENWYSSHKPFHWLARFYSILNKGGFDIIIGNPPYLERQQVKYEPDKMMRTNNNTIHAMFIERNCELLCRDGCISMILPISIVSTQRMKIVQEILEKNRETWYSNFSWRPGKLFENVNRAFTIFIAIPSDTDTFKAFSTNYQKWKSEDRKLLFDNIHYAEIPRNRTCFWAPKFGNDIERTIYKKFLSINTVMEKFQRVENYPIYYRTTGGLYWKVFTDFPPAFVIDGKKDHSTRETHFSVEKKDYVKPIIALLSSDLYWWWYTITSNCRDLNPCDIDNFPVPASIFNDSVLSKLGDEYLQDIKKNSVKSIRKQKQTGVTENQSFIIHKSKSIINKIDKRLAQHYNLTGNEVDFLINYDIKFRMGLIN